MLRIYLRAIKGLYRAFVDKIVLEYKKSKWRSLNSHNQTSLGRDFDFGKIKVGNNSYGVLNVHEYGNPKEELIIGNYVSIANDVKFILGGNHQIETFTTFPLKTVFTKKDFHLDAVSKGSIILEDECWIGINVTILSGVRIGKGAIVAAGSVITKDVKPYSIVGGNPSQLIKFRYDKEHIDKLEQISLSEFSKDVIIQNIELFYMPIEDGIDKIFKLR